MKHLKVRLIPLVCLLMLGSSFVIPNQGYTQGETAQVVITDAFKRGVERLITQLLSNVMAKEMPELSDKVIEFFRELSSGNIERSLDRLIPIGAQLASRYLMAPFIEQYLYYRP